MADYFPNIAVGKSSSVVGEQIEQYSPEWFLVNTDTHLMYLPQLWRGNHRVFECQGSSVHEFGVYEGVRCLVGSASAVPQSLSSAIGHNSDVPADNNIAGYFLVYIPDISDFAGANYGGNWLGFTLQSNTIRFIINVFGVAASRSFRTVDDSNLKAGINIIAVSQVDEGDGVRVELTVNGVVQRSEKVSGSIKLRASSVGVGGAKKSPLVGAIYSNQIISADKHVEVRDTLWNSLKK